MKTNNLTAQNKILKKYFGLTINLPKEDLQPHPESDGVFLVPKWQKLGETYHKALQNVLDAIHKDRSFYNYRKGELGEDRLRPLAREVPEVLSVQLGKKYKGVSVENVRKQVGKNEILLGAYEVAIILLLNPEVLTNYTDLFIDCPDDEYDYPDDSARWSNALCFNFGDDRLSLGCRHRGNAHGNFGSASGFSPQPLESRNLDSFDSLETRIKVLENKFQAIAEILTSPKL